MGYFWRWVLVSVKEKPVYSCVLFLLHLHVCVFNCVYTVWDFQKYLQARFLKVFRGIVRFSNASRHLTPIEIWELEIPQDSLIPLNIWPAGGFENPNLNFHVCLGCGWDAELVFRKSRFGSWLCHRISWWPCGIHLRINCAALSPTFSSIQLMCQDFRASQGVQSDLIKSRGAPLESVGLILVSLDINWNFTEVNEVTCGLTWEGWWCRRKRAAFWHLGSSWT